MKALFSNGIAIKDPDLLGGASETLGDFLEYALIEKAGITNLTTDQLQAMVRKFFLF